MLIEYLPIALLFLVAVLFVGLSVLVAARLGPYNPNVAKSYPYESGILPDPENDITGHRFPVRFYLVAMLFIIFDVEAVFVYPWATVMDQLGWFGLISMGVFLLLLLESYYYVIRKGGLDWN